MREKRYSKMSPYMQQGTRECKRYEHKEFLIPLLQLAPKGLWLLLRRWIIALKWIKRNWMSGGRLFRSICKDTIHILLVDSNTSPSGKGLRTRPWKRKMNVCTRMVSSSQSFLCGGVRAYTKPIRTTQPGYHSCMRQEEEFDGIDGYYAAIGMI